MKHAARWTGPLLAAVTLLVACAGCPTAPSPATQIVGTWQVDPLTATGAVLEKARMRLELQASGQFSLVSTLPVVGEVRKSGTWKYLSAEGNKTRIELKLDEVERPVPLEIEVLDADTLELVPPFSPIKTKARFRRAS